MPSNRQERSSWLLLLRLLVAPTQGMTAAELRKALKPWWEDCGDEQVVEGLLAGLDQAGSLSRAKNRWMITPEGRSKLLAFLGSAGLTGNPRFEPVINQRLVPLILGLPHDLSPAQRKRAASTAGVQAQLIRLGLDLDLPSAAPTPTEVRNAAAEQQLRHTLGFSERAPGLPARIQGLPLALALSSLLGAAQMIPAPRAFAMLAARAAGSDRALPGRTLRQRIVRRWIEGEPLVDPLRTSAPTERAPIAAQPPANPLEQLRAVLNDPQGGLFGKDRIFIASAHDQLKDRFGSAAPDRSQFDAHLLSWSKEGAVTLSRADYVEAMDPDLVRRSAIEDRGAQRHFILLNAAETRS